MTKSCTSRIAPLPRSRKPPRKTSAWFIITSSASTLWSDKKMIRFLQTQGPAKKIILSGILLVICGAMVIAFIPGGLTSDITGTPGQGVVAKVDGGDITADQVRLAARQML